MRDYLAQEWYKLRKVQLFCIGLAFLAIASFIGLGIYFANQSVFTEGTQYQVMWGQLTFYYSQVLSAPMLAIFMAMSLNQEFERKNIEMLRANAVSIRKLLFSKLVAVLGIVALVQVMLFLVYLGGVLAADLALSLDVLVNLKWIVLSVLASASILSIQSYLFSKSRNFSQSVGLSALGAMGGFVLLFINENLVPFYPYSQVMVALRSRALEDFRLAELVLFFLVNVGVTGLFYQLSCQELAKTK
ncbi:ABC transporter permease [Aerococcus urinae]|uniref:ABC transporter permease n=1 Tax=Aerococcus mictus TaxID=2976810 RepID=A0ABZ2ECX1_9LACT|nr:MULTISPECIES: ABC transporter permease [Aerococcus]KAA9292040.1 ABC transporter permease [Aerococcus mictus]MBU5610130.1 ABC transporter permease [Aerococcus urinae]MCY3034959.1 ABC transporter permease [Aerococcus mictus]MCY3063413.1 ABC transporter permease [Aerococcus mictus]MCY3067874.1 ABC transporter permease [Aerococcus mictus]